MRKAADAVLTAAKPADDEFAALREAFIPAMVRVNDSGEYVRRPARWGELPAKARPLLERLADARLLVIRQENNERSSRSCTRRCCANGRGCANGSTRSASS